MPEYVYSEYAWGRKYGRVLNMQALHSILNMPAYALAEIRIYLGF